MTKRSLLVFALCLIAICLTSGHSTSTAATQVKAAKFRGQIYLNAPQVSAEWTVPALCQAYQFPTGLAGGGIIGIAEFGGGYLATDLALFSKTYMNGTPIHISTVNVDGTSNSPGVDLGADAEVTLDIEIAAAAYYYCTGKAPTIKMFFAGQSVTTDDAFINSNTQVINAAVAAGCDVLSISWGTAENYVTATTAANLEAAAAAATKKGMAIFAASGDGDATNERQGETDRKNHILLPSSAPHIVAVGGTSKTFTSEVVWNNRYTLGTSYPLGTGGGFSTIFPAQSWQAGAPVATTGNNGTGRMVPDVAANADVLTPYMIAFEGSIQSAGNGTSAATPLWAGLFASFTSGQKLGNVGPTIWLTANRSACHDITSGDNKGSNTAVGFNAAAGPDACTGVGVPIGTSISKIFVPTVPTVTNSNTTVSYAAGKLTITGDQNSNSITVSLISGAIKVEGANGTKINASASPFTAKVSGALTISVDMGAGDDGIQFIGVEAAKASVSLGNGNDKAAFTLSNIGTLSLDGGAGTDFLLTTSTVFTSTSITGIP